MSMHEADAKPSWLGRVVPALLVSALGVAFLLNNLGVEIPFLEVDNWWRG